MVSHNIKYLFWIGNKAVVSNDGISSGSRLPVNLPRCTSQLVILNLAVRMDV